MLLSYFVIVASIKFSDFLQGAIWYYLYKRIVIVIYVLNECVTKELITVSGKIMLCSFKEIPEVQFIKMNVLCFLFETRSCFRSSLLSILVPKNWNIRPNIKILLEVIDFFFAVFLQCPLKGRIHKQFCCFQLQDCFSIYDLLVDTRR